MSDEKSMVAVSEEKMDSIIKLLEVSNRFQKINPSKGEKDEEFPSDQDKEFIENSVELVLTKLCPTYPVRDRSGYFELGNFFVLIELHNSRNHLIVGMKTEHNMRRELMELSFIFTEKGGFEISSFPGHEIDNLVFKFFIELRKELERKRLLNARRNNIQKFFQHWKERLSVKDSFEL